MLDSKSKQKNGLIIRVAKAKLPLRRIRTKRYWSVSLIILRNILETKTLFHLNLDWGYDLAGWS